MFDQTQVKKYQKPSYHNNWYGKREYDMEADSDLCQYYGISSWGDCG